MARYLLDTNHISPLVTLTHPLREKILLKMGMGDTFIIPLPALSEFLFGIRLLPRVKQNLTEWERLKGLFDYYYLNLNLAEQSAELRVALRKKGWQLEIVDSFIAVLTLKYDLTLLTTDRDFEAISGLKSENWMV
ncbi:type II toxin-antitoxin system VapC family toxin [Anaerolineales bacterium HSG25]|nr:type II toxin-antitoxin system VapC family toxin [Anaerolineales bacterium HSG25]